MSTLADFQHAFAAALRGDAPPSLAGLAAQPGFAVYRNTVTRGCVDALQANYRAVARLVGEEWFRAAAAVYVREHPPRTPMLVEYGAAFADFLAAFAPADGLPYLPGVARCDRLWTEAHVAADATPLDGAALAAVSPGQLGAARLHPHPAARWAWFDDLPVADLWLRNRDTASAEGDVEWRGGGVLVTRPHDAVMTARIGRGGCAFLDACAERLPVSAAVERALDLAPDTDLSGLMAQLVAAGAFTRIEAATETPQ
jgi:Putative DNA-binding domain